MNQELAPSEQEIVNKIKAKRGNSAHDVGRRIGFDAGNWLVEKRIVKECE